MANRRDQPARVDLTCADEWDKAMAAVSRGEASWLRCCDCGKRRTVKDGEWCLACGYYYDRPR